MEIEYKDKIIPNSEVLFIVESPHTEEVKHNSITPLVGSSGKIMSEVLGLGDEAIGLNKKNQYSLMNSFTFPLQETTSIQEKIKDKKEFQNAILKCEKYKNDKYDIDLHKEKLKEIYANENFNFKANFENRLKEVLDSTDIKSIIICGTISQAYLEFFFPNQNLGWKNKIENINIYEKNYDYLYVWHPSENNKTGVSPWKSDDKWHSSRIKLMKDMINL